MEELILLECSYYPKPSIEWYYVQSKFQWHSLQKKTNSKIHMKPQKTLKRQSNHYKEEQSLRLKFNLYYKTMVIYIYIYIYIYIWKEREAWLAAVLGVARSQIGLSD